MNKNQISNGACRLGLNAIVLMLLSGSAMAGDRLEVMHGWTSGSEAAAVRVVKEAVEKKGVNWVDSAIAGDSGNTSRNTLQARIAAGNPPAADVLLPQFVKSYSEQGLLIDLNSHDAAGKWEDSLPPELAKFAKEGDKFIALPIDMGRHNFMYVNKGLLDKFGGLVPKDWDEWIALADKMKAGGVLPIAHSGTPWQELYLWEDVLVGVGGSDLHKKALEELDPDAIKSPAMMKVFDTFRKVTSYADADAANREWNVGTNMVMSGKAAFQFMGDWANGEFVNAGKKPDVDYICAAPPGNEGTFLFLGDFFVFFPVQSDAEKSAQAALASVVMDPEVQRDFNLKKGSIPARMDVSSDGFNPCAQKNMHDRDAAHASGKLLPTLGVYTAQPGDVRGVFEDAVAAFSHDPSMTPAQAAERIVKGLSEIQ